MPQEATKLDLLQGTLDLLILQTLQTMGAQHGYGLVRRIEQVSGRTLLINQGTVYASLVRLQQRGWISAVWGESDHHRRAKFYSLTRRGRRQLQHETTYWRSLTAVVERVLNAVPEAE
jgi:transcriptional regulator